MKRLDWIICYNFWHLLQSKAQKRSKIRKKNFSLWANLLALPKEFHMSICLWNKTGQTLQKHFVSSFQTHQLHLKQDINTQSCLTKTELIFPPDSVWLESSATIKRLDWVQSQSQLCWKSAWSQCSMLIHIRRRNPRGRQIIRLGACAHKQQK